MGRSRISALFAALGVALATAASASVSTSERASLIAIYESTGGSAWTDGTRWGGAPGTECSWFGVQCDVSQSTVTGLFLGDNSLSGTLPPAIGALANLTGLDLGWNDIRGALPAQIAQLSKLEILDLSDNHFEGELPPPLLAIDSLTSLRLGGNRFSGEIPPSIGQLLNLVALDLSNNQFRGEAPSSFQSLTKLGDGALDLRYNAITISSSALRSFLEGKQTGGDILGSQTLPPTNLKVEESHDPFKTVGDVIASWDAAAYISDPGGYRVSAALPSSGTVVAVQTTASKEHIDIVLTGIGVYSYVFSVTTVTHPHGRQQNTLESAATAPVLLQRYPSVFPFPRPVVGVAPEVLVQTGSAAAKPVSFEIVNIGDSEATVSLTQSGAFFSQSPSTVVVQGGSSETITIVSKAEPAGTYEGWSLVEGDGIDNVIEVPVKLVSTAPLAGTVVGESATPRVDLSKARGTNPTGSASFTNRGSTTLYGVARSDVAWIVPQSGAVTIPPSGSRTVGFTIDRSKRPDAWSENGAAFAGALTLDYVDPESLTDAPSGAEDSGGSGTSTSLVSVIDTVTPPVQGAAIPPLGAGELALFVPGVAHQLRVIGGMLSDVSIANAFGSASVGDVSLYFLPSGSGASPARASMGAVAPRGSVLLADVVSTVYGLRERGGSLQLRSLQASRLLAGARLVTVKPGRGVMGTMLPVFRSTRAAKAGEEIRLAGIGLDASEADLIVQETSGLPASVRIEYLDATGGRVSVSDPVEVQPFGSIEYRGVVPDRAATALVTNRSNSPGGIVAYGRNLDADAGDVWVVNDWSRLSGFDPAAAQKVVYVPLREAEETRRRPVRRYGASARDESEVTRTTLELTMYNAGLAPASAWLTYFENGAAIGPKTVSLGARETRTLHDVVRTLFGRRGVSTGWLSIEPRRGASLAVSARVVTSGSAPSTATVPVTSLSAGLRLGQMQLFAGIDDARQATIEAGHAGTTSTTLGLAETGGAGVSVRVSMVYFDGSLLAARITSKEFTVGANSVLLVPNIARAIVGEGRERELGDLRDIQLEIRVAAGDGAVTPFVIATDSGSGDAIVRLE